MKFSEFMNSWLYGKDGYYSNFNQIGKKGDFYTAVSTSKFFGGVIAKKIISSILKGLLPKNTTILEIGAHQGYLIADIIQFIYTLDIDLFYSLKFAILEPQESLRKIQKEYIETSFGESIDFKIYSKIDEISFHDAFVVSNEIFDAFACELIKDKQMLYVDNFDFYFDEIDTQTKNIIDKMGIVKGEVPIGYDVFIQKLHSQLKKYIFLSFDYGDMISREDFSIRIYDKHKVYPFFSLTKFVNDVKIEKGNINIANLYKKSDITYDVNFSYIKKIFQDLKVTNIYYSSQAKALIDFGLIDLLEILKEKKGEKIYLQELNKIKILIDPTFMGERFKCFIAYQSS